MYLPVSAEGGQALQISRVQTEDGGRYTCQAVNEAGEDQLHFDLEVLGKNTDVPLNLQVLRRGDPP